MEKPPEATFIPKPLKLDIARYQHYLDATRLSVGEKEELLHTLWNMTCEFVYLGYGISAAQQAKNHPSRGLIMRDKADQNSLDSMHPNPIAKEKP